MENYWQTSEYIFTWVQSSKFMSVTLIRV